jgi:hypothetical protein
LVTESGDSWTRPWFSHQTDLGSYHDPTILAGHTRVNFLPLKPQFLRLGNEKNNNNNDGDDDYNNE